MTIEDKIQYMEDGLGFNFSSYLVVSDGAVASKLFEKGLINKEIKSKLETLGNKCNFLDSYWNQKPLNNQSILFVNLVYEILKKQK